MNRFHPPRMRLALRMKNFDPIIHLRRSDVSLPQIYYFILDRLPFDTLFYYMSVSELLNLVW
jgi:hypothetical protein